MYMICCMYVLSYLLINIYKKKDSKGTTKVTILQCTNNVFIYKHIIKKLKLMARKYYKIVISEINAHQYLKKNYHLSK